MATVKQPARVSTTPEASKPWVQPKVVKPTINKPLAAVGPVSSGPSAVVRQTTERAPAR